MAYIGPDYLDDAKDHLRTGGKKLAEAKKSSDCKTAATAFLVAANRAGKALVAARAAKDEAQRDIAARKEGRPVLVHPKALASAKRAYTAAVKLSRRVHLFHIDFTDRCLR